MPWPQATTRDAYLTFQMEYMETSKRFFDPGSTTAGSVAGWAPHAMMDAVRTIRDDANQLNKNLVGSKITTVKYAQGVREYVLPSNFMETNRVEVTDLGGPPYPVLSPIDSEEIGNISIGGFLPGITGAAQGEPAQFYLRQLEVGETPIGGSGAVTVSTTAIGFDPIPSRSATTQNVNIWSVWASAAIPVIDMTTNPDPNPVVDLPVLLMDLVPAFMCIRAAIVSDPNLVQAYQAIYNAKLLSKLQVLAGGAQQNVPRILLTDSW